MIVIFYLDDDFCAKSGSKGVTLCMDFKVDAEKTPFMDIEYINCFQGLVMGAVIDGIC